MFKNKIVELHSKFNNHLNAYHDNNVPHVITVLWMHETRILNNKLESHLLKLAFSSV